MGWDEKEMATNGDPLDSLLGGTIPEEDNAVDMMANPEAFRAIDRGEEPKQAGMNPEYAAAYAQAVYQEQKSERAFALEALTNSGAQFNNESDMLSAADRVLRWLQTGLAEPWLPEDGSQPVQDGTETPSPDGDPTMAPEAVTAAQTSPDAGVDLGPGSR